MGVTFDVHRCRVGLYNSSGVSVEKSASASGQHSLDSLITLLLLLICGLRDLWSKQVLLLSCNLRKPLLWHFGGSEVVHGTLNFRIGLFCYHSLCIFLLICSTLLISNVESHLEHGEVVDVSHATLLVLIMLGFYTITQFPHVGVFSFLIVLDCQHESVPDLRSDGTFNAALCLVSLNSHDPCGVYLGLRLIVAMSHTGPGLCHGEAPADIFCEVVAQIICLLLLLGGIESNPGPIFVCKVCSVTFSLISNYCKHFNLHQSAKNPRIVCTVEDCNAELASVNSFRTHYSRFHSITQQNLESSSVQESGIPCPCDGCSVLIVSRSHYLNHVKSHFGTDAAEFICIVPECKTIMKSIQQLRTHVSRYHRDGPVMDAIFSTRLTMSSSLVENAPMDVDDGSNSEGIIDAHVNIDSSVEGSDPEPDIPSDEDLYPDNVVKEELARFYLKLEAEEVLPTSTVQVVASEIKLVSEMIHYKLKRALRKEMENAKLDKTLIDQVIGNAFQSDPIFNIHHKGCDSEQLGTDHLRKKFWRKVFKFIEPVRVFLGFSPGKKSRYAHFISVKESLSAMLEDRNVKQKVLKSFENNPKDDQILEDFTDGSAFKEHLKCHEHEGNKCLQLLIFQDGFDPKAFGGSGSHKPNGFYWTLGNLPAALRSKLNLIQLAYMILEKDLINSEAEAINDYDRMKESLKHFLDELADLRNNGIIFNGEKIHVCVLFLIGDSLGQNFIGRYVKNFSSSQFSCRFCTMSKDQFLSDPHETKPFRTAADYDEAVITAHNKWLQVRRSGMKAQERARNAAKRRAERVAARSSAPSKKLVRNLDSILSKSAYKKLLSINFRGVKNRPSPFNNEDLKFHVVGNQVPCLAHDLFEGIIKLVVPEILKHCIEKNWFSLVTLNKRIMSFKCHGTDALDRPKPVKSKSTHLTGNAVENWNFIRLLPLIIGDLIEDINDPFWCLLLTLQEICTYVCAPKISLNQVVYLRSLIETYLADVKELLPHCLTPKHHYLAHYPDLILRLGPLIRLFTLRFESKHAFFKLVMRACKNFINITYTMARKYACRSAFDRSGNLLPADVVYEESHPLDTSIPAEVRPFIPCNTEQLEKVTIMGTKYLADQYVILNSHEGFGLRVGCIRKIFLRVHSNEVLFLLEESTATNSFSGYYEIEETSSKSYILQSVQDLHDHYPLSAYSISGQLCLCLKHSAVCMD